MTFFKPGISCPGRALERSQEFVPWTASLQAWGANLWICGTVMLAWQGRDGRLWECCLFFARGVVPPPPLYHVHRYLCSRSVCLSLTSKECKPFPRDLSWTAARSDDISCCAALGRDRSTPWVPRCLILPASLGPQAPVPWGWTDSAQQVRRRQQVLHAAFSAHNPQITASALAHSPSPGKNGICRTDNNKDVQSSHLACYLQIIELIFWCLSLKNPISLCLQ